MYFCLSCHLSVSLSFWLFTCGYKLKTYEKCRPVLAHKVIKIWPFRFFEKSCYLNLLEMILNGIFVIFTFLLQTHPIFRKTIAFAFAQKLSLPIRLYDVSSDCMIFQTSISFRNNETIKLIFSCGKTLLERTHWFSLSS